MLLAKLPPFIHPVAVLLTGVSFFASGCKADSTPAAGWTGERTTRGDTVVIFSRTPASPDPDSGEIRLSAPAIAWASDSILRPSQIEPGPDSLLFVVDGTRIFVLGRGGTLVDVLGRRGQGPGEFRSIEGVRFLPPDTLLAWDGANRRLSWLSLDGQFMRSVTLEPPNGYGSTSDGRPSMWRDSVLIPWSASMVMVSDSPDSLVVAATPLSGEAGRRLLTLPNVQWSEFGGVMAPATAYAPAAQYAFGSADIIAATDGIEACVNVYRPDERLLRMCREWTRPHVGSEERTAEPLERVEASDRQRTFLTAIIEGQAYPELRNSIRHLLFDKAGNVWAQMVDTGAAVHPFLAGQFPELRPATHRWTVFGSNGRWLHDVLMSSSFRPLLIEADVLYGVVQDEDGVPAIAAIRRSGSPVGVSRN